MMTTAGNSRAEANSGSIKDDRECFCFAGLQQIEVGEIIFRNALP